jgi:hypothetical protein
MKHFGPMLLESLFILALANFAIAITVTRSVMFEGFRQFVIKRRSLFWGNLFSCPYCFGHWSAFVLCWLNQFPNREGESFWHHENYWIQFFTYAFAVIGLSALFSYAWIRISGFLHTTP